MATKKVSTKKKGGPRKPISPAPPPNRSIDALREQALALQNQANALVKMMTATWGATGVGDPPKPPLPSRTVGDPPRPPIGKHNLDLKPKP